MDKVTIRPYHSGDELGILELYRAVFNVDVSLQDWQWFCQRNSKEPAIIVVAENYAGIVGHYAVQIRPFSLYGNPCLAGLAIGTMVHPSARNLTTLVEMAHLAYDICRQKGVLFLYAFSNDTAWKVRQVVLGWQALEPLVAWEAELSSLDNLVNSASETRIWKEPSIELLTDLSLTRDEENFGKIYGIRTFDWLNWRFFQNPDAEYQIYVAGSPDKIQGYAVLKQYIHDGTRYGHIVDWQVPASEVAVAKDLLMSIFQEFAASQVKCISCWALPNSSLVTYIQDAGLKLTGRRTNFGYLNLSSGNEEILADIKNWIIYMADSDVY